MGTIGYVDWLSSFFFPYPLPQPDFLLVPLRLDTDFPLLPSLPPSPPPSRRSLLFPSPQFPPRLSLSHHFPTFHCTLTPHPSTRPSLPFPNSRLLSLAGRRVLKAAVLRAEAAGKKGGEGQEGKGGWWGWLRGEGERLKECTVELSSRMPSLAGVSTSSDDDGAGGGGGGGKGGGGGGTKWTRAPPTAGGSSSADGLGDEDYDATSIGSSEEGWKFVRIVVKGDGSGRERQLEVGWGVYEMWMEVGEEEGQGEDGKGGR